MAEKVTVTLIGPDSSEYKFQADTGEKLRDIACENNVPGILGECGGHASCGTCHVVVDDTWIDRTGRTEPDSLEDGLLDMYDTRQPNSRLSCQIILSEDLDGLVVRIPEE